MPSKQDGERTGDFRKQYLPWSTEYLLDRRELGSDLASEAHDAIEQLLKERGEPFPPRSRTAASRPESRWTRALAGGGPAPRDPISRWLRRQHAVAFIVVLQVAVLAAAAVGFSVLPTEPIGGSDYINRMPLGWQLLLGCVFVPLVETLVFQWVPITKLRLPWYWGVALSASMFGMSHWYSLRYMFATFLVGLVFAYGFVVRNTTTGRPFLLVAATHAPPTCLWHSSRESVGTSPLRSDTLPLWGLNLPSILRQHRPEPTFEAAFALTFSRS